MLRLATENQPGLIVDTRELDRQGASYMVDTLVSLRRDYLQTPLLLIIGSDAFNRLTSWHQWQQLFDFAHIIVLTRPGFTLPQLDHFFSAKQTTNKLELTEQLAGKLYFQPITQLDISATKIREMITSQRNPAFLLSDAVISYINQNKLYQTQPVT